ncbi:hypothetical protein HOLleu_19703 [Holothuria leucospilota]|uniref:Uncharacterized protein n=1 Tax=Holothuria leucospilota TaxID=206669 RepID=A0A9Q1BZZ1_HOLLE|nr:hypothetical protein HOLleu_19703 [Holothuria leucospilota]
MSTQVHCKELKPLVQMPQCRCGDVVDDQDGNISCFMKVLSWTLALKEWSPSTAEGCQLHPSHSIRAGRSSRRRTRALFLTSLIFLILLTLGSFHTAVWYTLCFNDNHLSSFLLFYWPVVMSAQIVCATAAIKKCFYGLPPATKISWMNIFSESHFFIKLYHLNFGRLPGLAVFVFCYVFALFNSLLEICYFSRLDSSCHTWPRCICLISHILNLFFYSSFCYFLYLHRVILKRERKRTLSYVSEHIRDLKACMESVRGFYRNYYQLRKLLLPWINVVLFSTAYGVAVFFAPSDEQVDSTVIQNVTREISSHWLTYLNYTCNISCEIENNEMDNSKFAFFFDCKVLSEKIMLVALALIAVGGMDIKYEWECFKMKLNLMYPADEFRGLQPLLKFLTEVHPNTARETITTFLIPFLGIACGIFSSPWS